MPLSAHCRRVLCPWGTQENTVWVVALAVLALGQQGTLFAACADMPGLTQDEAVLAASLLCVLCSVHSAGTWFKQAVAHCPAPKQSYFLQPPVSCAHISTWVRQFRHLWSKQSFFCCCARRHLVQAIRDGRAGEEHRCPEQRPGTPAGTEARPGRTTPASAATRWGVKISAWNLLNQTAHPGTEVRPCRTTPASAATRLGIEISAWNLLHQTRALQCVLPTGQKEVEHSLHARHSLSENGGPSALCCCWCHGDCFCCPLVLFSLPRFCPHAGAKRATLPLAPEVTAEDRALVDNVLKIVDFLTREKAVLQVLLLDKWCAWCACPRSGGDSWPPAACGCLVMCNPADHMPMQEHALCASVKSLRVSTSACGLLDCSPRTATCSNDLYSL
eukprot:scaffold116767_cov20-Tisochrysis_lutea.AAC.4